MPIENAHKPTLLSALAMSAGAAVVAEATTLPFDTAKVETPLKC